MILIVHTPNHLLRKKPYKIMKDPVFLSSPIYPPFIPSKPSRSTNSDDHLIPLLSPDDFIFKAQLTYLSLHPTYYSFRLYDKNQDFFTSIASKTMSPYQYWLGKGVKFFSLQFNFLLPSIYDLKTDEFDPSFLSMYQKAAHHQTYTKFLQHTKPKNYIFANYKYTSQYTMTNMYTLDHSYITGYLRIHDPIKQYFCLLPYKNTSRPPYVPQEYLIYFDDFLLPCNIPTQIVNLSPLLNILYSLRMTIKTKPIIQLSTSKRTPTMNFYLFLLKPFLFWYKQNIKQHKSHTSSIRNTPNKLSSVMNNRTLRDNTILLDPYKRNPSGTPITTLTHKLHCYACTKPELVGHRPHFLLDLGGTGTRWDIISGTSFFT